MSIEKEHLAKYQELFVHRRDLFGQQTASGSYVLKRNPVTEQVISEHLNGERTCGWYALGRDSTVRWAVIDSDRPDGLLLLRHVWRHLQGLGLPSYLEASRRGGHLWLFFEPIPARDVRQLLDALLRKMGVSEVELSPKQDSIDPDRGVGSLVRGPLGMHRAANKRFGFLYPDTLLEINSNLEG